jgi:hypothetical protein
MKNTIKPRARQLNELLIKKGHAVHKTAKHPSRAARKQSKEDI